MKKLFLIVALFSFSFADAQKISDGKEVIAAMYKKYEGGKKWYKHFTFTQEIQFYRNDSVIKTEVWHEAGSFPGKLSIKFDSKDSKNGVIFTSHKVYSIKDGVAKEPKPMVHDLILMGFDVYFLKPERTIQLLDSLGFDLKQMHEDVFEGRKVYVVGAQPGNEKTPQFWIDAERLYMHRIIYKKNNNITDCIFGDYEKVNGNWAAKKIIFKNDGQLQVIEKYYDLKFPKELDPAVFDPARFGQAKF